MSKLSINTAGLSMLEVIITIAVITIGIMALTQLFPISLVGTKSASFETAAVNLAEAKLEELISIDYDELAVGTIEPKARLATSSDHWLYQYQRETTVAYADDNLDSTATDTGLKKVNTVVSWYDRASNSEQNITLHILLADK